MRLNTFGIAAGSLLMGELRKWRDHLADLIEACGFSASINPWKGVFGVRGWRK